MILKILYFKIHIEALPLNLQPMKTKSLILLCILWTAAGCTKNGLPQNANMFQNKSFVNLLVKTEQECMESQTEPDFFHNCHQQVDFKKNNEVHLMLTDIYWQGKYRIEGDMLILSFEPNHEIPDGEIRFDILHPNLLLKSDDQSMWKKLKGKSIWD